VTQRRAHDTADDEFRFEVEQEGPHAEVRIFGEFELSLLPGPRHVHRVFEKTQLADTLPFRSADVE
jgi:hypothetical protein